MSLLSQVLLGTGMLVASSLVHVTGVTTAIPVLRWLALRFPRRSLLRTIVLLSACVTLLLAAHGAQIWLWAGLFYRTGHIEDLATSLYFSTVTYTTLGYGDVVLDDGIRLVGTFAAVSGLMAFGISTAFLMGVLGRVLPASFGQGAQPTERVAPSQDPEHGVK